MKRPAAMSTGSAVDDRAAQSRLTSHLAVAFLLDAIAIARGDGHVLDTLLMSAIIQANVQEINRRADLQVAFALSDQLPSDDLRRPVSMNAIASSLRMPFETVRRRIQGLVRNGYCAFVDGGVIVPSAVLSQPRYYADGLRGFERLRAFYYKVSDLGLLRDLPPPTAQLSPQTFPVRVVARLAGTYVLRVVEALGAVGDLLDALILLEIYRSNGESSLDDPTGPGPLTPITVTRLAARIGVPLETVRRHVSALTAGGACVRVRGGLIVPEETLSGAMRAALEVNVNDLQRLFGGLSQLGVLSVWDQARPRP